MKKTFVSRMIKKNTLSDTENTMLTKDIVAFNSMKRTAFSWNNKDITFDDGRSIHLHLKNKYGCNDYFANSANREAKALINSQKELRKSYITDKEDEIDSIHRELKKKRKRLKALQETQDSIIQYTKNRYSNPKKIKGCQNVTFEMDGRVKVQIFKKKTYFDNLYLFEHQWLKPNIKRLTQNIKTMEYRIQRLGQQVSKMKKDKLVHVCFGTKKLYHDTRIQGETRKNTLSKKRNHTMMISGRADSNNGNYVFHYDTKTNTLYYNSMNHWGTEIAFQNVIFLYGQEELLSYLDGHKGAIAWEIRDFGNAWQIACVINVYPDEYTNNCFVTGCVSYDMNYDNISYAETDKHGNLLFHKVIYLNPDTPAGIREQEISHALEEIFKRARDRKKPVVCEKIESVQRKKFYDKNTKRTRHISMFACSAMAQLAESKSIKYGITLTKINPAYTSKTGLLKYKKRYGLTTHEAAAFVIGRRGMGIIDKVPDFWKQKLDSKKQNLPRMKQWAAVYKVLQDIEYEDLNRILYPSKIDILKQKADAKIPEIIQFMGDVSDLTFA